MEPPVTKRCRPIERFCGHCNQIVAYKTYKAHKRLFYNPLIGLWFITGAPPEAPLEDSIIDDGESPPGSSEEANIEEFDAESPPCSNPALSESETSLSDDNSQQQSDQADG